MIYDVEFFGLDCCPDVGLRAVNNSGAAVTMRVLTQEGLEGPAPVLDGEGLVFYIYNLQCPDGYSPITVQILDTSLPVPAWRTVWTGKVVCTTEECD